MEVLRRKRFRVAPMCGSGVRERVTVVIAPLSHSVDEAWFYWNEANMLTAVGQHIIHPHHGPVRVDGFTTRTRAGRGVDYVDMSSLRRPLKISLPLSQLDAVGVRPLLDAGGVLRLLELLGTPTGPVERSWSRRIKDYRLRLQTGRLEDRATVMRDIIRHVGAYPPAGTERDLLREVRAELVLEIELCLGLSDAHAEQLLNDAVHPTQAPTAVVSAAVA